MRLNEFVIIVYLISIVPCNWAKRGPHHPRSDVVEGNSRIDSHLLPDNAHIKDDLEKDGININLDNMTDDEKHFYYFKTHDSDNNNALDGLEMLHAALHHKEDSGRSTREEYVENASAKLDHIIDVIDEFMEFADINRDGYLHYAEYMKAMSANREQEEVAALT